MYLIITIIFFIGIITGAITIKILGPEKNNEIMTFLNSLFGAIDTDSLENISILKQSILDNFKAILVIWFSCMIYIGIIITPAIMLFRGFALGFSVGFFVNEYGAKGFLFSVLGIFPQNLFIIPGMISIASIGIAFSVSNFKRKKLRVKNSSALSLVIDYSILILLFSVIVFLGCLIEAYIAPIFLRLLTDYVN